MIVSRAPREVRVKTRAGGRRLTAELAVTVSGARAALAGCGAELETTAATARTIAGCPHGDGETSLTLSYYGRRPRHAAETASRGRSGRGRRGRTRRARHAGSLGTHPDTMRYGLSVRGPH